MDAQDPVLAARRSAERYWNVDGLAELYAGLVFLLVPALYWAARLPGGERVTAVAMPVLLIPAIMFGRRALLAIRRRLTYPRTGYVSPRRHGRNAKELAGIAVLMAVQLAMLAALSEFARAAYAICGLLLAILDVILGRRMGLRRFYLLAALCVAAGIVLTLLGTEVRAGMSLLFGIVGAGYVLSGSVTLWGYLRAHPPAGRGSA